LRAHKTGLVLRACADEASRPLAAMNEPIIAGKRVLLARLAVLLAVLLA
jgi:hypothetical protein